MGVESKCPKCGSTDVRVKNLVESDPTPPSDTPQSPNDNEQVKVECDHRWHRTW